MPKRPKGRLLVGALLVTICGIGSFSIWNALFRYEAFGVVTGKRVHVTAPWGGVIRTLHVREGDEVRQGQLLATVINLDLERKLTQVADELLIAQAELEAAVVRFRHHRQDRLDLGQQALTDYYELWGELAYEQARLSELEARRHRGEALQQYELVADEEMDTLVYGESGQREKVERLKQAVKELKRRVELFDEVPSELRGQLRPYLTRIEVFEEQLRRTRELVQQSEIRAPVNAKVIQTLMFTGEYAGEAQPVLELLVEGSLEAVLYVRQDDANRFSTGSVMELELAPTKKRLICQVVRFGEQLQQPPASLRRNYRADKKLLPVHLLPLEGDRRRQLRLGSEVKLPSKFFRHRIDRADGELPFEDGATS